MSQEELGFAASLHRNYVGSTERGERNISVEAMERWLAALGLTWEAFGRALDRMGPAASSLTTARRGELPPTR